MAEHSPQDAVNQAQSADALASSDVSASPNTSSSALDAASSKVPSKNISSSTAANDVLNNDNSPNNQNDRRPASTSPLPSAKVSPFRSRAVFTMADPLEFQNMAEATVLPPLVNGVASDPQEPEFREDISLQGTIGEGSGTGSDAEMRDSDVAEAMGKGDGRDKIRRYSVKKPASFKPVSVTKSFLAKTGTSTPAKASGDKGEILFCCP
jgi:hypothetical protein